MKSVLNLKNFNENIMSESHKLKYLKQMNNLKGLDSIITLLVIFNGVLMIFNEDILGRNVMIIGMVIELIFFIFIVSTQYKLKRKIKSLVIRYIPQNKSNHLKITYDFEKLNKFCLYVVGLTALLMIIYLILTI